MALHFRILGPLQVLRDGQELGLGTVKQRMLLAALALEPNRTVSLDRLVAALWEDAPPRSAISNLRTYANRLRTALAEPGPGPAAPRIVARRPGYVLHVEASELDSVEFAERLRLGRDELARGAPRDAARQLAAGLALWRGLPAEDLPRALAVRPLLDSLEEQRCLALETQIAARIAIGEHDRVITQLRDLLGAHPTRERLWAHLMLALYRSGDLAAALAAYSTAQRTLAEQLGVDPGPELVSLHQAMLNRDPALAGPRGGVGGTVRTSGRRPRSKPRARPCGCVRRHRPGRR